MNEKKPRKKAKKAREQSTAELAKRLFPREIRDAVRREVREKPKK